MMIGKVTYVDKLDGRKMVFYYRTPEERRVYIMFMKSKIPEPFEITIAPECSDVWIEPGRFVAPEKEKPLYIRPDAKYGNIDRTGFGIAKELHSK